jgi:hypothetical protein
MQRNDGNNYIRPSTVLDGMPDVKEEGFRRPTTLEVAQYFKITSEATVHTWWHRREKIFGDRTIPSAYPPKWLALEKTPVEHFMAARKNNRIVTVHWFRRMSLQI